VSRDGQDELLRLLHAGERFVVTTHQNPDGDALGSLLGMEGLLKALGKEVVPLLAGRDLPPPPEYRHLDLGAVVTEPPQDLSTYIAIALDCGNFDRLPSPRLAEARTLVNIDHHHDNTGFGDLNLVQPTASCTAEIVFSLFEGLGVRPSRGVAEALYIGVVTDTGRFMYENTGPAAHRMAAALLESGVDPAAVYHRIYEGMPEGKVALLARALNKLSRRLDGRLTYCVLSHEDFAQSGAQPSYSEGVVDHLRAVEGTVVAALIREVDDGYKVSLRSTTDQVDVSQIARRQGGGGHRRAAGFHTTLAPKELLAFVEAELVAQLGEGAPSAPATFAK